MTESKLGCSGVHIVASRGLQGPGLNVTPCMKRLHRRNKCHLLKNNFNVFSDSDFPERYSFTRETKPSRWRIMSECFYSYLVIRTPFNSSSYFILFYSGCQSREESTVNATASQPSHAHLPCTNTAF